MVTLPYSDYLTHSWGNWQSRQDSNLDYLIQIQMCCHYTTGLNGGAEGIRTLNILLAKQVL